MKLEIKIKGILKKVDVRGAIVPKEYFASPWLADGQLGLLRIFSSFSRNTKFHRRICTMYSVQCTCYTYTIHSISFCENPFSIL